MHPFSTACFQGVDKRCIGNKWVKYLFSSHFRPSFPLLENQIFTDIFRVIEKEYSLLENEVFH